MSQQSIDTHNRVPKGLLSALGTERTVAMIVGSLALMAFLILSGAGHEKETATGSGSNVERTSVFSGTQIPGVDIGPAE